jgi:hypothetical protein
MERRFSRLAKCKFFPASFAWISLTGFRHPITFGHSAQKPLARQAVAESVSGSRPQNHDTKGRQRQV